MGHRFQLSRVLLITQPHSANRYSNTPSSSKTPSYGSMCPPAFREEAASYYSLVSVNSSSLPYFFFLFLFLPSTEVSSLSPNFYGFFFFFETSRAGVCVCVSPNLVFPVSSKHLLSVIDHLKRQPFAEHSCYHTERHMNRQESCLFSCSVTFSILGLTPSGSVTWEEGLGWVIKTIFGAQTDS